MLGSPLQAEDFKNSDRDLQYFRTPDKTGLNVFEPSKEETVDYQGFDFRLGGANTMQFQALDQSGEHDDLNLLGTDFNLPTANLDFDAQLHKGMRMHLRSWVASQRQGAAFHIKGGYIQIDRLDFIQEDLFDDIMDNIRVKIGHMDFNYGDTHFRRTDNAQAIHNPFVGNYLMDAYTNEIGGELYYLNRPYIAMAGVTNSQMNQSTLGNEDDYDGDWPTAYGKLGYDRQFDDDLRARITGSVLYAPHTQAIYLYEGDRAGGRYYNVLAGGDRAERVMPDFSSSNWAGEMTAFQINPFVKYGGLEFFGVFEMANGQQRVVEDDTRTFTQLGGELLYRFGRDERFYAGGRYNLVSGERFDDEDFESYDIDVDRFNIGAGWFMADNVLMKAEFVQQNHDGFRPDDVRHDATFEGIVAEAIVSF